MALLHQAGACWGMLSPPSSSSSSLRRLVKLQSIRGVLRCCVGSHESGEAPQEAVLKAISEVSRADGRKSQATNVVIGGTVDSRVRELDEKVNTYPMSRGFTAIGTGGEEFVQAMVLAVESVMGRSILQEDVSCKQSARGKYVSVRIGPLRVESFEQVQAIYDAMRMDSRMKYFL